MKPLHSIAFFKKIIILLIFFGIGGSSFGQGQQLIINQPASALSCTGLGHDVAFSVASTDGISYQWYHNGEAIIGATQRIYTITSVKVEDYGTYYVHVTGIASTYSSNSAYLNFISQQPSTVTIGEGNSNTFSIELNHGASVTTPKLS